MDMQHIKIYNVEYLNLKIIKNNLKTNIGVIRWPEKAIAHSDSIVDPPLHQCRKRLFHVWFSGLWPSIVKPTAKEDRFWQSIVQPTTKLGCKNNK